MDSRSPLSPGEERAARSTPEAASRTAPKPGQLDPQQIGPALLVERFATFCKTCFIYPDNSQHVQVTGELVLDSLRGMFSRRPMVEIVVGSHDLVACGVRLVVQSHGQIWLRDLLVKALIGGFEFTPAVDVQALTETTRRLQRAQTGKERGQAVWPDNLRGIRTRELVMSGSHAEGDGKGGGTAPGDNLAGPRSGRSQSLANMLGSSPRVKAQLEALRKIVPALSEKQESAEAPAVLDVIAELVRCLPAEATHDHGHAEALAERILTATREQLLGIPQSTEEAPLQRDRLAATFLSIGQKMFRTTLTNDVLPPAAARGHGDDAITDNLDELLKELEKLRAEFTSTPLRMDTSAGEEVLGIVLHTLSQTEEIDTPTVRENLLVALRSNEPNVSRVLADYLEMALSGDEPDQRPTWRIFTLLDHPGVSDCVQGIDLFGAEGTARHFPKTFGLFLDTLTGPAGQQKLTKLLRLLSPAQLNAADAWLEKHPQTLSDARLDKLFASLTPRSLPFAILALRHAKPDCKAQVTKTLRQLGLAGAASVALRVVDPPSRLPREYLEQLCTCTANEAPPSPELVALSGGLTRSFIQALAGQPEAEARRIFAIQALRDLPGSESRVLLKEIATAAKGFVFKRESAAVGRAARETHEVIAAKTGGRR
jgi:hypothetical protein